MINKGRLTAFKTKSKETEIKTEFKILFLIPGDVQAFLDNFQDDLKDQSKLFIFPIKWKSIKLDFSNVYKIVFDELEIEAVLKRLDISRKYVKGNDVFKYVFTFEKDLEQLDQIFSTYLNQKEQNPETGKRDFIMYDIEMNFSNYEGL